jgi:hypothetical protein
MAEVEEEERVGRKQRAEVTGPGQLIPSQCELFSVESYTLQVRYPYNDGC